MPPSRSPEELSIINAIQAFARAIRDNNPDSLRSSIVPSGSSTRTGIDPSRYIHISLSQLVEYISEATSMGDVEGRFDADEATVKVDGELGIVWTKWESFKDGRRTHKGSMVFTLVRSKEDGKWFIVSNADNLVAV